MYIKRLKINNFRGIKDLDKEFNNRLICLIGNSDSTKTTILDAIEYCLYPYWNIQIMDTDFYNCNINENIVIQLTIGDVPEKLLTEDKYGLFIRKNVPEDEDDEPNDDEEKFLTIELRINEMLECKWKVINNRSEGKNITHVDRAEFSVARVGENTNKDFRIGRSSILKKYMDDTSTLDTFLIDAVREIKEIKVSDERMRDTLEEIKKALKEYSVKLNDDLKINMELKTTDVSLSNLNLCDGIIPFYSKGTGTKRLISVILNLCKLNNSACILIDEIEYGLEPYRISELIYKLKEGSKNGQVIMTTHSPIVLSEVDYNNLLLCRNNDGKLNCFEFDQTIQRLLRSNSYAFICNNIIVVEGATESGILRFLNRSWSEHSESMAMYNSLVMDGKGGYSACQNAERLSKLGYRVCLLIDSDEERANNKSEELEKMGIKVFKWDNNNNTEMQIINDLPDDALEDVINLMLSLKEDENIVKSYINEEFGSNTLNIDELKSKATIQEIKEKFIKILTHKDRFKNIRYGMALGKLIEKNIDNLKSNTIINVLNNLKEWYKINE